MRSATWQSASRVTVACAAVLAASRGTFSGLPAAPAGITRLEIVSTQTAFEGRSFGSVGTYQKLRGKAYGQLDPNDPRNAVIADLALAPRNARGRVEYSRDINLLTPTDPAKGNHKLYVEVNNRGAKLFGALNQASVSVQARHLVARVCLEP